QEIGDGTTRHAQREVGSIRIAERASRAENVETDEHLDVGDRAEFARRDQGKNFMGGLIEDVVVILDQDEILLYGVVDQGFKLGPGYRRRFLHDHMSASIECRRRQREMRYGRCSDMNDIRSEFVEHAMMVRVPGRYAEPLGGGFGSGG